MQHIGIVGVTAEGSALCYRLIVSMAAEYLYSSILHPEISIHNFSFHEYYSVGPTVNEGWDRVHDKLLLSINKLKNIGADFVVIPANTVHHNFHYLEEKSPLPIINIIDLAVSECEKLQIRTVGLLGTNFIMNSDLYKHKLLEKNIIQILPCEEDQIYVDNIINDFISNKPVISKSNNLIKIIDKMNCDTVIFACTELPLILKSYDVEMQFINTTALLAEAALKRAIFS